MSQNIISDRILRLFTVAAFLIIGWQRFAHAEDLILEHLPEELQARVEIRDRHLGQHLPPSELGLSYVIEQTKSWNPGGTVRVAFEGGSDRLRQEIAEVASEWTRYANIKLDFQERGRFREWSESAQSYSSEIRIGFRGRRYWSLVGTDSIDPNIVGAGEPSMNFGGFDLQLPDKWKATVLHEFGHALGFLHEHQHPVGGCDDEFRWWDDPGYAPTKDGQGQYISDANGKDPGIYTRLGGAPNHWPRKKVDHNLRELEPSHAYVLGPFDPKSIMKYEFPSWMFVGGESSRCFSVRSVNLSDEDRKGAAIVYPFPRAAALNSLEKKIGFYEEILRSSSLPPDIRRHYQNLLQAARHRRSEM